MITKIVSGGQTGVDRAALEWARRRGLPHGGWCPRGRLAEDGPISRRYALRQTPQADYAQRTEWNIRDSDATVVFSRARRLTGGSRRTWELAVRQRKPHLHLRHAQGVLLAARRLRAFAARHRIRVLNVAGPRASTEPAVGGFVQEVLERAFPRSLQRA